MLTEDERKAIVESWRSVQPTASTLPDLLFGHLLDRVPSYRGLFGEDLASQKIVIGKTLDRVVAAHRTADETDWRTDVEAKDDPFFLLLALGRRYADVYQVPAGFWETLGEALVWTIRQPLGPAFTPTVEAAWTRLAGLIAAAAQLGARGANVDVNLGRLS